MGHGWVFMEHGKSFCITDSTIRKSSGQKLLLGTEAFLVVQFVSHKRPISILYKTLRNSRIIKSLNQSLTFSSPRYCQFHFIGIFFSHQLQSHTLYAMLWNVLFLFEFFNELFGLRLVHTTLRICCDLRQMVAFLLHGDRKFSISQYTATVATTCNYCGRAQPAHLKNVFASRSYEEARRRQWRLGKSVG